MNLIPFNKPYLTGRENTYMQEAMRSGKLSGDGMFTKRCHQFFEEKYGFKKVLLTTSCTDALELAAILLDICEGDEVIMPSYTFVSTSNAFVLRGAKIIFADSKPDHPNMDVNTLEKLITPRTKAIVPVHYAGMACDMEEIMALATKHNLFVVEDAAQAIDAYYNHKPLGAIGHMAAFSFHDTKNIICGEGGMLVINNERFIKRAEIVREKGTNRSAFFRGEVDKYGWVDVGSSFLISDLLAAFLYAQLEQLDKIQERRKEIWIHYQAYLQPLANVGKIELPVYSEGVSNNAHAFFLICKSHEERTGLIAYLKANNVSSVFHYISLHKSIYYASQHDGRPLPNADKYTDCLLRLPLFPEMELKDITRVSTLVLDYYNSTGR